VFRAGARRRRARAVVGAIALAGLVAVLGAATGVAIVWVAGAAALLLAIVAFQEPVRPLIVLAYFVVVHVIEGDVVGPRIVGQAIGLHPVVSLAALIAGSELFGIWGALFASPVAGVLQALIIALWTNWRETHPEEFEQVKQQVSDKLDDSLTDHPVGTTSNDHTS